METLATKKRISLAEMSIPGISFIQHIHGNLQEKTGPEVGSDIYRGYYTVARRYEFYVRVARTISHQ